MTDDYLTRCFANQQGPEPSDAHELKRKAGLLDPPAEVVPVQISPSWDETPPSDQGIEGAHAITYEEGMRNDARNDARIEETSSA